MQIEKKTSILLLSLLLILSTLLVFDQVRGFDFVHYDDDTYVLGNRHVQAGLTSANIVWALTATEAGFWHPLTWLSLMLDYDLYRLNPGGYHGTNLIFHLLNTLLLFLVLADLTGGIVRSAFVAGLFALHPLHVESVAWIAERKDVLSAFFWLLTLGLYSSYVKRPSLSRYLFVLLSFSMGLMAKPMLVTLPCVLLLLDFWPLGRFQVLPGKGILHRCRVISARPSKLRTWGFGHLLLEKVPLLFLSLIVVALTFHTEARAGALASLDAYPLTVRISHSFVSYWIYLGKMFWPIDLAVFYPHPGQWPLPVVGAATVSLLVITYCCLKLLPAFPYAALGWFWYLCTMAPVIGFVQLGSQGMADRYTYIPLIGIFIMAAWGVPDILHSWRRHTVFLAPVALALLLLLGCLSWRQVGYWQDAKTLFQYAIKVTKQNYLAHNNLGAALAREGEFAAALVQYAEALHLRPQYADALFNRGQALAASGRPAEAEQSYRAALQLKPFFVEAQNNLGIVLANEGKNAEARLHFEAALRLRPDYEAAGKNLRFLLQEQTKLPKPGR